MHPCVGGQGAFVAEGNDWEVNAGGDCVAGSDSSARARSGPPVNTHANPTNEKATATRHTAKCHSGVRARRMPGMVMYRCRLL
ncbi:MAG: hypothetical protein RIE32_05980 [Phycisphaerales bacterium]